MKKLDDMPASRDRSPTRFAMFKKESVQHNVIKLQFSFHVDGLGAEKTSVHRKMSGV